MQNGAWSERSSTRGGPRVAIARSLLPVGAIHWQRPEGATGKRPADLNSSPKELLPRAAQGVRSQKEEAQSLWPLTLSLERRLQEDMTVCFLGLPLGLLPLFRLCTSFSCSLETQHQSALRSPTCKPFSGFSLHPLLPRDPCCSSLQ